MSDFLFPPAPPIAAPIRGRAARFPIRRIFCVGRNYEAHAREMGVAADREAPFYFTKASEHYAPSGSTIAYPPGTSNYHYEMELVVAIGKRRLSHRRSAGARPRVRLRLRTGHDAARSAGGRERKAAALGHRQRRRAVGGARRDRAGRGDRPPRAGTHRAARQRSDEAVSRPVANDSRCRRQSSRTSRRTTTCSPAISFTPARPRASAR